MVVSVSWISLYFKCPPEISLHVLKLLSNFGQEFIFYNYGNLGIKLIVKCSWYLFFNIQMILIIAVIMWYVPGWYYWGHLAGCSPACCKMWGESVLGLRADQASSWVTLSQSELVTQLTSPRELHGVLSFSLWRTVVLTIEILVVVSS